VFFTRLFLLTFSAILALVPMSALSAEEVLQAASSESSASHTTDIIVLNNDSLPAATATNSVTAPAIPAIIPAESANVNLSLSVNIGATQNDLWQRIRNGFAMHDLNSSLIARHERWYADRPEYVARMMERSQRYLFFITEEVEKRGMPTEIALLPMIESAFNPGAYSIGNASGIWQFIPSTGKNFGLQQNWWYDGRRDIVNATRGALDYLQKLHDQFGDWELALAAYNWGEGAVERAQDRNRRRGLATNYASLKMPDETRNYIPKLLAIKNIVSNPNKFGLELQSIPDHPYFTAVTTARHIDVKLAAKLADISLEEFIALNPAHNRPVILQENADVLLLPVEKAESFRANLESYSEPLVSWQAYQSKKGERLDRVAPRFGLSVAKLKSINGLSQRAKLSNGQSLLVPLNGEGAENDFEAFNTHLLPSQKLLVHTLFHTVKKGETLSSVARHYHVSVAKLKSSNNNIAHLNPGQTLTITQIAKHQHLAKVSRNHIKVASTKSKKHLAHKTPHHLHVASR
jgi:membrane-bound lytic murein transglycosylase D